MVTATVIMREQHQDMIIRSNGRKYLTKIGAVLAIHPHGNTFVARENPDFDVVESRVAAILVTVCVDDKIHTNLRKHTGIGIQINTHANVHARLLNGAGCGQICFGKSREHRA